MADRRRGGRRGRSSGQHHPGYPFGGYVPVLRGFVVWDLVGLLAFA